MLSPYRLDFKKASMSPVTPTTTRSARTPRLIGLLGPAMVAGIAYLDPGNVASNMTAGSSFGYLLVWVVVVGNLIAWLVQYLSAKLGLVTGQSLAEILGQRIGSTAGRRLYWVQAELVAMSTDIAEVIGGAIALSLLFDLPLIMGGTITGAVSLGLLTLSGRGRPRTFERVIIAMMLIIVIGFAAGLVIQPPPAASVLGGLVPGLEGSDSLLLAASILGATVMPHAIYAHSALTRDRFSTRVPGKHHRRLLSATRWDVSIALIIAGSVNLALLLVAATSLRGLPGTDTLAGVHATLSMVLGPGVALLFAIGLLASGLASAAVGAYAGSEVMSGLLKIRVSRLARRLVTLIPALVVLSVGIDPTRALVLSQVVLSFGIPFALVPLIWLTSRRSVLGEFRNRWYTSVAGIVASVFLIGLNVALLVLTFVSGVV